MSQSSLKRHSKIRNIIIGSLYKLPNASETEFLNSYKFKPESKNEIIFGLDHNLDLLKCNIHKNTNKVLELNLNNNILQSITRPTHITKTTATLIDTIETKHVGKEPLKFKTRNMTKIIIKIKIYYLILYGITICLIILIPTQPLTI